MIPIGLHIVALMQLLAGISAAMHVAGELTRGRLFLDFGLIGIPAYFGLMRLDSTWRSWTLALIRIGLVVTPFFFVIGLDPDTPVSADIFGIRFGSVWPGWISVMAVPLFAFLAWQHHVLTRPAIVALFAQPAAGATAGPSWVEPGTC